MNSEKKHLWDEKKNIITLLKVFFSICVLLFAIDFIVPMEPHMPWEAWPGFYALYGLVACVILVLVSKYVLRPLVEREENYYD